MGAPAFKYQDLFSQHNVRVFFGEFRTLRRYEETSVNLSPGIVRDMESIASIFPAFLDFYGTTSHYKEYGDTKPTPINPPEFYQYRYWCRRKCSRRSPELPRNSPKKHAPCILLIQKKTYLQRLKWLKIEDVWGIGRQYVRRLQALNIKTAYDFTNLYPAR